MQTKTKNEYKKEEDMAQEETEISNEQVISNIIN